MVNEARCLVFTTDRSVWRGFERNVYTRDIFIMLTHPCVEIVKGDGRIEIERRLCGKFFFLKNVNFRRVEIISRNIVIIIYRRYSKRLARLKDLVKIILTRPDWK